MDRTFLEFLKTSYAEGLCEEYKDLIRRCGDDRESLIRLALRQQSLPWVIDKAGRGIITKDYLLDAFGEYINESNTHYGCDGVVGYAYRMYAGAQHYDPYIDNVNVAAFLFMPEDTTVRVRKCKCPTLYIGADSDMKVICGGYNNIIVYLFDKSRVTISDADDSCGVTVYRYSDKAEVRRDTYCLTDKIKIFDKELKL